MTRSALLLALSLPALALAQTGTKDAQTLPSLAPLVESVKAAVVNVDVQKREAGGGQGEIDEEMPEGMTMTLGKAGKSLQFKLHIQ